MDACTECAGWMVGAPIQWDGQGSWDRYIALQGFQDAWEGENQTEQAKYGNIVKGLEDEEEGRKTAEANIVRGKQWWSERRRLVDLAQHEEELGVIFAAADEVQLAWAWRTNANRFQERQEEVCRENGPQLYDKIKVWLGNSDDVNSKELTVATTLMSQRYYLGRQGGDYIFRYLQEDNENGLEDVGPDVESAKTTQETWEDSYWRSALRPEPADVREQFQYCGQVPRSLKEYTARLKVVLPAVVLVVVSLIGFVPDEDNLSLPEELEQLRLLGLHSPRSSFAELHRRWGQRFPNVPGEVRGKARRSAMVLEFAHLLAKMAAAGATDLHEHLGSVVRTLEEATNWTFFQMIEEADRYTARIAVHELLHEKNFEHVLVFKDTRIEDIHDFYNHDNFRADPSHPLRRYESVDVSAALAVSDRLFQIGSEDESSEAEDKSKWGSAKTLSEPLFSNAVDDSSDKGFSAFEDVDEDERPRKRRQTSKSTSATPKKNQLAKKPGSVAKSCSSSNSPQAAENYTTAPGKKRKRSSPAPSEDKRIPRTTFQDLEPEGGRRRSVRNLARRLDG